MLIDLHCHTKYSEDNNLDPSELIHKALERGLDAVCITEHDSFLASEPVERIAEREGFPVFRGVEINTDRGHILAFGVKDDSWKETRGYYSRIEIVRPKVEACGGILIPAHPFRTIGASSAFNGLFDMNYIAAMEVLNGENTTHENEMATEAWARLGIPGTAGSDCHYARMVGTCATWFERPVSSIEEIIAEIKGGRIAPAFLGADGTYSRHTPPEQIGGKP